MSEQGGASRRSRREGFGLFKRRRQPARSRSTTPDRRLAPSDRGDLCQLSPPPPPKQSGFQGWKWLFGRRSQPSLAATRRARRAAAANGKALTERPTRLEPQARQLSRSPHALSPQAPPPLPPIRRDRRQSLASLDSSFTGRTATPGNSGLVPFLRRPTNGRRPRPGDPRATRLQSQPTLIQASTSLQPDTLLQDQDTTLQARRPERSRRREVVPVRPRSRSLAIALYASRMLILSVGVGVLAGTLLSAWNPATNPFFNNLANQPVKQASSANKVAPAAAPPAANANTPLTLAQELTPVKTAIQTVSQQYPGFTPGVFLIDLDTNNFMDLSGSTAFPAASTIKVPVLIAFFQEVDAGKIRLDEKLTMRKELIASEAGDMQYLPVGAQFTALETATKMITISDNTATNMLIDRLGGMAALNQRFKSWGLTATQLTTLLPDLKGTNTTSPKELASLMVRVSQGELVSLRSRDRLLDIMSRTINNSQLPQGLGDGATIAHKTGDISSVIGDVGLIDMPSGKRYATAVMIRRQPNDDQAYDLVQKISRAMYQHFINTGAPKRPTAPAAKPSPEVENSTPDAQ